MIDLFFILCAKYLAFVPIIIAGIFWLLQKKNKKIEIFFLSLISVVVVGIIALLSKHIFYDPRPFVVGNFTPLIPHAADNGFPSDHTLLASFIASVFWLYNKKIGVTLWIITILVAISRVYVGVHHPIDVIGSILISIVGTWIGYQIFKRRNKNNIA